MVSNYMAIPLLQEQRFGIRTARMVKMFSLTLLGLICSDGCLWLINVNLLSNQCKVWVLVIHCVVI